MTGNGASRPAGSSGGRSSSSSTSSISCRHGTGTTKAKGTSSRALCPLLPALSHNVPRCAHLLLRPFRRDVLALQMLIPIHAAPHHAVRLGLLLAWCRCLRSGFPHGCPPTWLLVSCDASHRFRGDASFLGRLLKRSVRRLHWRPPLLLVLGASAVAGNGKPQNRSGLIGPFLLLTLACRSTEYASQTY